MKVSKKLIIKALRTEPLKAGRFFHAPTGRAFERRRGRGKTKCKVCAVGAIVAAAFPKGYTIKRLRGIAVANTGRMSSGQYRQYINHQLKEKEYISALSILFEGLAEDSNYAPVTKTIRNQLIDYVKENFPETINLKDTHD